MIYFILGIIIGLIVRMNVSVYFEKKDEGFFEKKIRDVFPKKAQFIEPVSKEEKFNKANNISDLIE